MPPAFPLIIVGGGLAGSLAALALARARPHHPLLLLEEGEVFGGNHTWSFFDSDIPASARYWVEALQPWHNAAHRVVFASHQRHIRQGYNSIESNRLDALVRARLGPRIRRSACRVVRLEPERVILADGEEIRGSAVIDARGPARATPGLDLGWQKFVGIEFAGQLAEPGCATIMDATVPQLDGFRFIYSLPLAANRLLVEDTYYSEHPALDIATVTDRVRAAAIQQGITGSELRHEHGVLPIVIDGDPEAFWPASDPLPRLGIRGGFFHATTGYSFPLALAMALDLAEQSDLSAVALAGWSRARFIAHWRQSGYFRLLNRMMFRAAAPAQRHRIFERFYRLPEPLIARFYSGTLTLPDKLRLVAGRPPVPIGAALQTLCLPRRSGW